MPSEAVPSAAGNRCHPGPFEKSLGGNALQPPGLPVIAFAWEAPARAPAASAPGKRAIVAGFAKRSARASFPSGRNRVPRTGGAGWVLSLRRPKSLAPTPAPAIEKDVPCPRAGTPGVARGCLVSLQLCMLCSGRAYFARGVCDTRRKATSNSGVPNGRNDQPSKENHAPRSLLAVEPDDGPAVGAADGAGDVRKVVHCAVPPGGSILSSLLRIPA
jgi:hypothetical protein